MVKVTGFSSEFPQSDFTNAAGAAHTVNQGAGVRLLAVTLLQDVDNIPCVNAERGVA
jgi:hypothetical protein